MRLSEMWARPPPPRPRGRAGGPPPLRLSEISPSRRAFALRATAGDLPRKRERWHHLCRGSVPIIKITK
jgi:hypothetical protein